jgi:hypothetical protein
VKVGTGDKVELEDGVEVVTEDVEVDDGDEDEVVVVVVMGGTVEV